VNSICWWRYRNKNCLSAFYEASIVTHRLPGETFAQRVQTGNVSDALWSSIGRTIAEFHRLGVFHADLNVHNIIVDENDSVSLIDFDRARFRKPPHTQSTGWCLGNIDRLERSLVKVSGSGELKSGFLTLKTSWMSVRFNSRLD